MNIWQFCNQITFEFLLFPKSTNFVLGEEGSILLLTVLSILPSSLLVQSWIKRKNEKFKSYLGNVWGKFGSYLEDIRTKPKILVWSKFWIYHVQITLGHSWIWFEPCTVKNINRLLISSLTTYEIFWLEWINNPFWIKIFTIRRKIYTIQYFLHFISKNFSPIYKIQKKSLTRKEK